ncbi:nuclear transport factor 2 family protein [Streptomyces laculatispora]|uniref:nuclear transport factor 2 family protein n=1 Tax=Streptomyces laculatispora TaxID=887464 RepID=UPI001A9515E3|nr:nuclear transport factor 2 family protein [Streptomyces laculatispora]MBO0913964.1 nuclear transport factor 2 family protein [Streptomyces laculatispora]
MTQRVDLSTVMDRISIDAVITGYAVAVDDGEWADYRALFTSDGRADYRAAGGIEGPASEVAQWLSQTMLLFPVRQHLIVNRRLDLQDLGGYPGDGARVQADYLNPMRLVNDAEAAGNGGDESRATAPNFVSGGRYAFDLVRTDSGWQIRGVTVQEKWRSLSGALAAG